MPELREVVSAFEEAIWRGKVKALRALATPVAALDARIRIYRNNVFFSLTQALGDLYPRVRRFVGPEFFGQAARVFLAGNHPRSPAMVEFGAAFPAFLRSWEPLEDYRYLADVAAAELSWHQAYHAADATPLARHDLTAFAVEAWARLRLTLHPSVRLVASSYPLDVLWDMAADDGEASCEPIPRRGAHLLIARPAADVEVRTLTAPVFNFLEALAQGQSVLDAAEVMRAEEQEARPGATLCDLVDYGCFVAADLVEGKTDDHPWPDKARPR